MVIENKVMMTLEVHYIIITSHYTLLVSSQPDSVLFLEFIDHLTFGADTAAIINLNHCSMSSFMAGR